MRIVFMGTPAFAVESLRRILDSGHEVAAVVTAPDKPKGRGLGISESEVKKFSARNGLKILQPTNLKSEAFLNELRELAPELIVIVAFRILPAEVFSLPPKGSINLHASLLPKYRGAAPINRAIMNGDSESGVTTFFLKKEVDAGSIIMQKKVSIGVNDNAGTLHDKLAETGAEVLAETIDLLASGSDFELIKQDDSMATPAPKIFRDDCLIVWTKPAGVIHNQIRGLSPYPGAFTKFQSKLFKVFSAKLTGHASASTPGTLLAENKRLYVNCADNMIELLSVQPEGKRRMSAPEFLAGHPGISGKTFSI